MLQTEKMNSKLKRARYSQDKDAHEFLQCGCVILSAGFFVYCFLPSVWADKPVVVWSSS